MSFPVPGKHQDGVHPLHGLDMVTGIDAFQGFWQAAGDQHLYGAEQVLHAVCLTPAGQQISKIDILEDLTESEQGLFKDFLAVGDIQQPDLCDPVCGPGRLPGGKGRDQAGS